MRKLSLSLLLILSVCNISAQTTPILPHKIHQKTLPNGLNVVTIPYESPGLAAFYLVVRVGSREEVEPGKTGFAHFFEHMMFRGTEKYSKDKYSDILKSTGASANANTWLDRTVYHMTGNAAKLEVMFDLEADRFQKLKYSVQDFKTEAGAVKGEYTKNNASPYTRLNEAVSNTAFDQHTYKHTTMGFLEDVVDMPNQYDYSIEFFKRFYRPEYTTILVVGDVTPDKVNKLAEKYFGKWESGNYKAEIPVEPPPSGIRYAHIQQEQFPPFLDLKFRGSAFSLGNNDFQALSILGQLLYSEKSPLYKKLVVDEQKARNVGGYYFPTRDPYLLTIYSSLKNADDMSYVYNEIWSAIESLKSVPVTNDRLVEVKQRLKYSFAMGIDSPDAIANSVSMYLWVTGDPEALNKSYALYDTVTPEDIQRVAKTYLTHERLTVGTIGPGEMTMVK